MTIAHTVHLVVNWHIFVVNFPSLQSDWYLV